MSRRRRAFALAVRLLLAVLLLALLPRLASAQSDLVVWVVPTDAEFFRDEKEDPTEAHVNMFLTKPREFFAQEYSKQPDFKPLSSQIEIVDVSTEVRQDREFARQLLGQQLILRSVSAFVAETGFAGRVRVRFFRWTGLLSVLTNANVADDRPHLIVAPSTWIANLADAGALAPLDGLNAQPYDPRALETARAEREVVLLRAFSLCDSARWLLTLFSNQCSEPGLYALPWLPDVRFLFYWKEDFEGASFGSRERFVDALKRARNNRQARNQANIPPFAFATAADWDLLHTWSLLLWGQGGSWGSPRDFLSQRESAEVLDFLVRLRADDLAAFWEIRRVELESRLLNREVSSIIAGPWMLRRLWSALGPNWHQRVGLVPPPFNVAGLTPVSYLGGIHLGLTPNGARYPEAARLLSYLTQEGPRAEAMRMKTDVSTRLPLALGDQQAQGAVFAGAPADAQAAVRQALSSGRYFPRIPEWATVVEDQSTRLELFFIFKLISEGLPDLARRQLGALRARLNRDIYGTTRANVWFWFWVAVVVAVAAASAWKTLRHIREKRKELEREAPARRGRLSRSTVLQFRRL